MLDPWDTGDPAVAPTVSTQFLHLQISTFDKSSIPTLAHSRMEIASLSFPLYSYPPLQPHYQDEQGQEHEDIVWIFQSGSQATMTNY